MAATPLCDALCALAGSTPLRMHMPGHKGKPLPIPQLGDYAALDFTELPPTGNLYEGDGPIGAAEALWAQAMGMAHCLFLTGGSTQGVLAALTLACPPGSTVLLDRGCHRSAYNALALLDLHPRYLFRTPLPRTSLQGPISPEQLDDTLSQCPEIKTVCITSPTYYGIQSNIPLLAAICRRHGAYLVVDAAHGAHLPFLGNTSLREADLVVMSAHKTLPAPGQSALLLAGERFSHADLRRAASLYGSSSPSYPMMAALDCCRAWMEEAGAGRYRRTAEQVARLRGKFGALEGDWHALDPCRLVIPTGDGFALEGMLQAEGIYPEMADQGHVVFICTCMDSLEDFARLEEALTRLLPQLPSPGPAAELPPPPPMLLSPRQARLGPVESLPLCRAQGRVSACQVAPYPPGVPVIAPGEGITKKTIAYLYCIGYNMEEDIQVVPASVCVCD